MKKSYQLLCLLLALSLFSTKSFSQNNLAAGDLAIVSYQSDFDASNPVVGDNDLAEIEDRFSLVVLKPGGLAAGTVIFFTTRGWNAVSNNWHDVDFPPFTFGLGRRAVVQWTVPAGGIAAGTEVFFISTYHDEVAVGSEYYDWGAYSNYAGTIPLGVMANVTPIVPAANSTDGMGFTFTGDHLLVYQTGPVAGPHSGPNGTPIRFVTALMANNNGTTTYAAWDPAPGPVNAESSVPPGLVNGQTAFLMSPGPLPAPSNGTNEPDNGKFSNCVPSAAGTCTALQMSAIIYNITNWTYNNSVFPLGTASSFCTYTILPTNTITLTSAAGTNNQTRCINTAITNITYSTTGATGATFSGLPAGVTGNWAANVVTISGSPSTTVGSPFNYTVTLTGGCGTVTATGTITVTPNNTITLTSAAGTNAQTVCINTPITNITYSTTGATGATFSGLPAGVTGAWAANVVTISGTPTTTVGSPFNYTVTLTGGCGTITATGTITVNGINTITLTSGAGTNNQSVLVNTPITNITYSTTSATGATFSGLPAGVTGNWAANVVTISGSPTTAVGSPFNYTVTLTGGCGAASATGTITVTTCTAVDQTVSASPTSVCAGGSSTITVGASQPGVNYTLRIDPANTFVAGPTASNGPAINFSTGPIAATTTYNVLAETDKFSVNLNGGQAGPAIPQHAALDVTNNFTIEGWIKPAGNGSFARLYNKDGSHALGISNNQNDLTFTRHTSGDFSRPFTFVNGTWYHIACTYVGGTVELFVNGVSIGTVGGVPPIAVTTFGGHIGSDAGGGFNQFNGNIDNVRIWNSVRTQAQIAANQAAFLTSTGNPTLVASWWLIEGAGNPKDYSANAINSTSLNATWQVDAPVAPCSIVLTTKPTVSITPNNTITLTSAAGTNAQTVCINTAITNITYSTTGATGATFSGLPAGVTGAWAANVVTISGSPTTTVGSPFTYTVTLTGGCGVVTATGTITVTPNNTITLTSAAGTNAQTVCINTAITNITYSTTGATGATFSGLPAGVTGAWAANVVTISGSPTTTVGSPFTYTVTLTGGCGVVTATGTITVTPNNTITLTSAGGTNAQTVCINTPITNITYSTTGATGATFSGLPAGVTGAWAANVVTISGSPTTTVGSPFSYTVTLTGGCGMITATGTITVTPNNTITLTSAAGTNAQTVCVNTPITNITYSTTGATGATFSGFPAGVTGNWAANVVTISGSPTTTVGSPFTYTVTLTGGCGVVTATGTITVTVPNTITLTSAAGTNAQTVCVNTPITNITYSTTGATGATFSGLPAGITGAWAANVVTITGSPTTTVGSPFTYTVTLTGGCSVVTATGTITVTPNNTITLTSAAGTNAQTVCQNTPITNITYSTTGATGATFSGLPAGVTGSWAANVVTISGTPTTTVGSPFSYTVTLTGGCGTITATGTITVNPLNTITLTSAAGTNNQTRCINTAITNITYSTTGATGATFSGLPAGVTGNWAANVVTISGSPTTTVGSPFNYTVTLTGGCGVVTATGTITVTPDNTITLTSAAGTDAQTVCINTPITNITYSTTGATGATFSGLPAGVTGAWAANVVTISGSPTTTVGSPFSYTVTLTGGCGVITATGTITVTPNNTITLTSAAGTNAQSICLGTPITAITYSTVSATGATFSGLPAGVTGNWAANTVTISGTPTATGTFNYTVTLTGGCGPVTTATGSIIVKVIPDATITGGGVTVCQGTPVTLSGVVNGAYTYQWGRSLFTAPFTNMGTAQTQPVTASGVYQLTVTQAGCSASSTTIVNVADYVFNGSLAAGDAVQTGRINRFAVVSTCAAPKACPGIFTATGARLYDAYTVTNVRNTPVCVTIGHNSGCTTNAFSVAYLGSFNPASLCTNYLADPGSSPTTSIFYEAIIPANGTIVVVVHEVNVGTGCGSYQLTVDVPRDPSAITVTPGASSCSGLPITLTAPVANSYSWSPGGATTQSIVHTTGTTNYTVTLGYGNNGCTATASQSVTIADPVVNPVPNQGFCNGASASVVFSGGDPGTVYNWTNTNTAIGLGSSGSGNLNFTATNATAAPISGTITVTPVNGVCTGTPITFTITVANQPNILSVTGDTRCGPGVANLSATANGIINWWDASTGGIVVNTGNTYSPNVTTTTTYYVDASINAGVQSLLAMPAQSGTFPGNVRGYWFTAPTDFVITSLSVPTTASSAGQSIAVVKFNGNTPPPVFSATTNAFTTQFITRNNAAAGSIPCNIPVLAGEVIGILGYRGTINSYAPGDHNTTIAGFPVQLQRLGMQFPLTTNNPHDIWREFGPGTSISRIEFEYSISQNCISAPRVPVTATVKPVPVITATPNAQTICSGSAITTIVLSTTEPGTTYAWTRDNVGTVTGIAASGTTDISGTLTNTTSAPITVTFTITSDFNGCAGLPITATVVVNPTATVNAVPNQVVCNGSPTAAVNFTSPTTGGTIVYNWTNNTPSIGLAAAGTGNIASFTAINATNAPVVATITVTPSYTNGITCVGTPQTFTITVNPTATVNAVPNQVVCNNTATAAVNFTSPTTGGTIVYNWTNNNPFIGLGSNGTGNIASFTATNATNAPEVATITVTPTYTNGAVSCVGTPITFTITVNPTATINPVANQTLCNGANSTAINFTSPTTGGTIVYNWTNSDPSIGLAASGSGNIPSFVAVNVSSVPVVATITVTPTYTNGAVSCVGTPITFTITVNPPPVINPVANQVVCNNSPTATVNFTSPSGGGTIVYNWTNNTPSIGLAASGSGDILSFNATNTTNAPVTATITVIMSYTNGGITCVSLPLTFTITVNPTPQVDQPANQALCAGVATAPVVFTSPTTGGTLVYNWTNNNPSIGLAASGSGNIPGFIAVNATNAPIVATITVTPSYTNAGVTCTGPFKTFTITVNPVPTVAPVTNKAYCTGATTQLIPFNGTAGNAPGTVYNWTNSNPAIGLAASGSGDIMPFVTTNATNGPLVATITVTPVGPTGCVGTPITFTITVNPTPIVNPVTGQVLCNGSPTAVINFTSPNTGPTGVLTFHWTNSAPSIGLAANGTGNIQSFTAVNTGLSPVIAILTVTPVYTNAGIICTGTSQTFTITVNPTPTVNPVANQVLCNGSSTAAVNFTGSVFGTIYNWTNNNTSIGLAASGVGDIASFVATNAGTTPQVATITVTPNFSNGVTCPGTPMTFTITVNPIPSVNPVASQVVCAGATVTQAFTGPVAGTVYNWTNSNTAIGLGASGTGNLNFTAINTTGAPITGTITVTPSYTNAGGTCTGTPQTFTITVNPIPTVNAVLPQVLCNGAATTAVNFTGAVAGTVYSWTNTNTTIGLAASGTGNIASFTATNTTAVVQTATITVTPSYTNGGTTCTGTPITFTITVNPTPSVNTIANQTVCNGGATTVVTPAGPVAGTVYSWTNSNLSIGLGASGTGTIPSFTAINTGNTPVTATITVTPTFTNGGISCTGAPITFTITVNPTATVSQPANQVLCNGATTAAVVFSGLPPGSVYNWTNTNTAIGLAASGTGNIPAFTVTNTTNAPITATITVTPTASGCGGGPVSFTITVNPTPSVNAIANQLVCAGSATAAVTLSGPVAGTVYTWTNNNTTIGLGASGTGNIPNFIAVNPTVLPVTATITVTPSYTNGGVTCTGPVRTFSIQVASLPNIVFINVPPRVCLTDTIVTLVATPGGTWSGPGVSGNTFSAATAGIGVHLLTYTVNNPGGCSTTRTATVVVNNCIERHNVFQQAIRIWPNPNQGRFSIQFNSDVYKEFKVKIVNARGQEVGYFEFKNLVYGQILPFDLSRMADGQYFLYVYNSKESGVFPIIIAR